MKRFSILLISFILLFSSCKKKGEFSSIQWIQVEKDIPVNAIYFLNDSIGFACGGKRDLEGHIYKTIDGGENWNKIFTSDNQQCLYDITFIDDSVGYAGGDYMYFLKTTDGGINWNRHWFKDYELSFHEKNRPDIKKIQFTSPATGYFVGGENYSAGGVYKTFNNGIDWSFDTLQHELNDIAFSNVNNGWIVGFGYIAQTTDGINFTEKKIHGDFYTGIDYLDDDSYILVSNKGVVYKYTNNEWSKIFNKSIHINDVFFAGNKGYIAGNNGVIMLSEDYGSNWKKYTLHSHTQINSITSTSQKTYFASSDGRIAMIPN